MSAITLSRRWEMVFILALTLAAFALRLVALDVAPPGWRDDELINMYTLSGELLEGRFPLYFTGASGHEPVYHYMQAALIAVADYNALTGHLLSAFLGTLSIPLTFVLARRLFGSVTALLAAAGLTASFWSLMYSRFGLRHINLVPLALAILFLTWTPLTTNRRKTHRWAIPLGLALGLSMYVYPAARLLPALVIAFGLYLFLLHRGRFRRVKNGYALALIIAGLLSIPIFLAIRHGATEAAAQGIGADARLAELAQPVRALQTGDPGPLLDNIWTTLGMFHATGDPEWLYNIPGRSIFNGLGGALFWIGVGICAVRWRRPRYFFLLLWLGIGLTPTALSVPAASLSHSILIQPLVYLLPALTVTRGYQWLNTRRPMAQRWGRIGFAGFAALLLLTNATRDLRDYFVRWPRTEAVRFLYRADYRQAARYLDAHPERRDWAIDSQLMGPWDRVALDTDTRRDDLVLRLFDPRRALVLAGETTPGPLLLTSFAQPAPLIEQWLTKTDALTINDMLTEYTLALPPAFDTSPSLARFENGLELVAVMWDAATPPSPGQETHLIALWRVADALQLPPLPLVANPPPPGVYSGPRLAVFGHVLAADGALITGDDGFWVDPLTLRRNDRIVQLHRFALPADAPPGPYTLQLGLYDPFTEGRWPATGQYVAAEADRLVIPIPSH